MLPIAPRRPCHALLLVFCFTSALSAPCNTYIFYFLRVYSFQVARRKMINNDYKWRGCWITTELTISLLLILVCCYVCNIMHAHVLHSTFNRTQTVRVCLGARCYLMI